MEVVKNKGLSEELTKKFPNLTIIHFCTGVAALCSLVVNDEGQRGDCIPMQNVVFTSQVEGSRVEAIKMTPAPVGCKDCIVFQNSQTQ